MFLGDSQDWGLFNMALLGWAFFFTYFSFELLLYRLLVCLFSSPFSVAVTLIVNYGLWIMDVLVEAMLFCNCGLKVLMQSCLCHGMGLKWD